MPARPSMRWHRGREDYGDRFKGSLVLHLLKSTSDPVPPARTPPASSSSIPAPLLRHVCPPVLTGPRCRCPLSLRLLSSQPPTSIHSCSCTLLLSAAPQPVQCRASTPPRKRRERRSGRRLLGSDGRACSALHPTLSGLLWRLVAAAPRCDTRSARPLDPCPLHACNGRHGAVLLSPGCAKRVAGRGGWVWGLGRPSPRRGSCPGAGGPACALGSAQEVDEDRVEGWQGRRTVPIGSLLPRCCRAACCRRSIRNSTPLALCLKSPTDCPQELQYRSSQTTTSRPLPRFHIISPPRHPQCNLPPSMPLRPRTPLECQLAF